MAQVNNSTELAAALAGGDTVIELRAGTYSAATTIGRGVTIRLADGVSMDAAKITGAWTIDTTSQVIIDGLKFVDERAYALASSDNYTALNIVKYSAEPGGHEILNSVFDRDPASNPSGYTGDFVGSSAQPTHRAINLAAVTAGAGITIEGNTFTGGNGDNPYAGDSWRTAVYSHGGAGETHITGNTFENVRTAVSADLFSDTVHITGNSFDNLGSGVSVGVGSDAAQVTTITGNSFGADVPDALNFQNLTTPVSFDAQANTFDHAAQARVSYGAGDDHIGLTAGADLVFGDGGVDTAVTAGSATFAPTTAPDSATPAWAVTNQGATDVLSGVEIVEHGGGRTLLVGPTADSGFTSIQAAIDAAHAGDHILIAAGVYDENVVVDKAGVTLEGVGDVTIKGTFQHDNPTFTSGDLSDWIATSPSYAGTSGAAVKVHADDVTLKNLNIDDFMYGVQFDTDVANATLTDVDIAHTVFGVQKDAGADVDGLTIDGGSIVDAYQGTNISKDTSDAANGFLSHVVIDGLLFQNITAKGIYTETLSDAVIRNVVMNDVGVFGRGDPFGNVGEVGSGFELNLKAGDYANIVLQNFDFHNVGTSNGAGTSHFGSAAISIKVRVDGAYAGAPASISDAVVIKDGVIDGTSTGIRVGEYSSAGVLTGTGVDLVVQNVAITGEARTGGHGDFVNDTDATVTVNYQGSQPSYSLGGTDTHLVFHDTSPPPPSDPGDSDPGDITPPPPPPDSGQGPPPAQQASDGFGAATGVDLDSDKASHPTIVLPTGEEVANPVYEQAQKMQEVIQQFAAGKITETQVIDVMVDLAVPTTAVALQTYQFFTGATPTAEGVAYLVNSDDNPTDLTDPYYAQLNPDNRYINFAANLGVAGSGAEDFKEQYGALSFEDAVRTAYDTIIGNAFAQAANIDVNAAVAYVLKQLAYFQALGGSDIGAKAAMVGYLMYAGMDAQVGRYYDGTRAFLTDAFHGEANYNVDLTGSASSAAHAQLEYGLA